MKDDNYNSLKIQLIEEINLTKSKAKQQLRTKFKELDWFFKFDKETLPTRWIEVNIQDVTWLVTCGVAKKPNYVDNGIPFLSAQNARPFKTNLDKIKYITPEQFKTLTVGGKPEKNDILYTRVGNCGEAAKVPYDFDFAIYVSLTLIKPIHELINSDFLVAFLNSHMGIIQAKAGAIGSGLKNLNVNNVRKYKIPLPPLPEQKRIVAKLDALFGHLDTLREKLDRIPELMKNFRQQVLTQAVTGKLTEEWRNVNLVKPVSLESIEEQRTKKEIRFKMAKGTTVHEHFPIPESWQWCKLQDIALKITDGAHNTPKVYAEGYPYLMAKDLGQNELDFSQNQHLSEKDHRELWKKCMPEKGDLLIVNIGAGTGNNALIDVDFEFSFKNIAIVKRPSQVTPGYLKHFFDKRKEVIFRDQTRGGAQPFLSLTALKELDFALPPVEEQTEIVRRIEGLFSAADKIEAQYQNLKEKIDSLPQAILSKAFKGELVAQNENDEPAEVLLERIKGEKDGKVYKKEEQLRMVAEEGPNYRAKK